MGELNRERILEALAEMDRRLAAKGMRAEVCLFGGAVMILAFQSRQTTKDIDAIFAPTNEIRELARQIGEEKGYDSAWFNDGVKGFVSGHGEYTTAGLPQFQNLKLTMPVPSYLLAMKCMAARVGIPNAADVQDVKFLTRHLGLNSPALVLDVVARYYPKNQIPPKTQYFVESIFEEPSRDDPETDG
jgi:hypothetical protein